MTRLDAISYGVIAGSLLVVLGAWLHIRRNRRRKPPANVRVERVPVRVVPPPANVRVRDEWDDDEPTTFHTRGKS